MSSSGLSWSDISSYVQILLDGGVAGVWIICWLKGWIATPREVDHVTAERDEWKSLYMEERESHERTREALRLASERGESTTEALQLVAGVMNAVRAQAGADDLPEAPRARRIGRNQGSTRGGKELGPPGKH